MSRLADWVAFCGGRDVHRFWLADGSPDLGRARDFAETLRRQAKAEGSTLVVEQRVNRVTVRIPG